MGNEFLKRVSKECESGTVLFRDGEVGNTMFVLQKGTVRIFKEINGTEQTLATLGAGEFFGEMAILNEKPRTASAVVEDKATVLVIDSKTFEAMVTGNTEIAVRLIKRLAGRLDNANELIDILMHKDSKARVILGLSREAEVRGQQQADGSTVVDLSYAALAKQVGVSEAEARSVMARLTRLSIVEETSLGFIVPDRMRLHEFLEFLQTQ